MPDVIILSRTELMLIGFFCGWEVDGDRKMHFFSEKSEREYSFF